MGTVLKLNVFIMVLYWFVDHLVITGSQRTTCRTCTSGHRSACFCCQPSASESASPGWCFAMKTSKYKKKSVKLAPSFLLFGHNSLCCHSQEKSSIVYMLLWCSATESPVHQFNSEYSQMRAQITPVLSEQ